MARQQKHDYYFCEHYSTKPQAIYTLY